MRETQKNGYNNKSLQQELDNIRSQVSNLQPQKDRTLKQPYTISETTARKHLPKN